MINRCYSELIKLDSFIDRFNYLKLDGFVGESTFGFDRYLNQNFYRSREWKKLRDYIIVRDNGCDLGFCDNPINGKIIVHHMNPINEKDIINSTDYLLNPEYLICTSIDTHNAIHYRGEIQTQTPIERTPNDTIPWR